MVKSIFKKILEYTIQLPSHYTWFSWDYNQASYTTHIACDNCMHALQNLLLNLDYERQRDKELFNGNLFYTEFLPEVC